MTLAAAILIFGISSLTLVDPRLFAQSTPQSESSASSPTTQPQTPPRQTEPEATKPSSAQPPSTQATGKPKTSTAKKTHPRNKAVPAAACDPPPANSPPPGSDPPTASPQPGDAQASSTPEATKPCPPLKIVVKQGGIAEQSIQLAGGSVGGEATQKRNAANQMLAATDENLKKISGRRLSIAEQGSVIQIRQFVDQSKSALTAGNLERAQTLAWKAKLLSEDLIKPQQ
jgi:hypothetical protein